MMKHLSMLCCVTVLVLGMAIPAAASGDTGSMRVVLDAGELPVTSGAVTLYQVGDAALEGFQLRTEYGGGFVRQSDAISQELASWLLEIAVQTNGLTQELDVDGCTEFYGLSDGLYLLVQQETIEGFYPFRPILITLPMDTERNIQVYPTIYPIVSEPPATGQQAAPLWGAIGMLLSGLGLIFCLKFGKKYVY